MVFIKTDELNSCIFNSEFFDNLSKQDYSSLKLDIEKNGIKTELHITKNKMILCGHQRWNIAKELEIMEVPCKIIDIDEKDNFKIKEYIIIDNLLRRHLTTEQKYSCIAELSKLYEEGRGIFGKGRPKSEEDKLSSSIIGKNVLEKTSKVTGINEKTIQRAREYKKIIDDKPELKNEKVSVVLAKHKKEKEIVRIKNNIKDIPKEDNIIMGDCLEEIKKLKDNSISCIIIDPPYGIDYKSNHKLAKYDKIDKDTKEAFDLLDLSLEKVKIKMLKDSHIYIFSSWKVIEKVIPIVKKYYDLKNILIWNKNNWSMGDLQGNYAEKYEMILFATKGNRNMLNNKRPINVLDFDRTQNKYHPTEKPVDLLKELVKNSTLENEIVLDYFAGSGSLGIACIELNRKFILIENDKEYFDTIKFRLKNKK